MQLKTIAVVGAGGRVGSELVKVLLNDDHFKVTALVRPTSKYSPPTPLDTIATDFDDRSSLVDALRGQDAVVCCIPPPETKFASQKLLIDAAIEAGVKLFFANEFVANLLNPNYALFPKDIVGDKVQVREYLEQKASEGDIAFTALNGGPFFDMWLLKGVAGFDIPGRKAKIYSSGNSLVCWTALPVILSALVNMLRNPEAIKNRAIFVSGVQDLTQNAILAALEAETGDKFEVEHVDLKPMKAMALEALAKGDYRQAMMGLTLNSVFNEEDNAANFWNKVENNLVGVQAVTVREAVKAALNAQR